MSADLEGGDHGNRLADVVLVARDVLQQYYKDVQPPPPIRVGIPFLDSDYTIPGDKKIRISKEPEIRNGQIKVIEIG